MRLSRRVARAILQKYACTEEDHTALVDAYLALQGCIHAREGRGGTMEEMNAVLAMLAELMAQADNTFIQVGKKTVALSDPGLPVKKGCSFVKDRLTELANAAGE